MNASRLIFTLWLVSSVAMVQLVAQETNADRRPIEEVKAKAEAGDPASEAELGLRYKHGEGVAKDQVEAMKWYRKAAEQNYALAQNSLGVCYEQGEGVQKDPVEAVKWYRKAAEQNLAPAQFNLGVCYAQRVPMNEKENLLGVAEDPDARALEAVKWYRKAAEQNLAPAQCNLGLCYERGEGVKSDLVEAVKWYRKAAEQNFAAAQYDLGMCYQYGKGVAEDSVEAYTWLLLAARQGDEDAKNYMTWMESKQLKPEQVAQGQKRAGEFKPR